ncbi:Mdm33 family-domain-containing protein [Umbelopsis sp. PMI_123]|nr:Mdm33 family-domain-containing protein [Umbelopsis sp. PMI_123]
MSTATRTVKLLNKRLLFSLDHSFNNRVYATQLLRRQRLYVTDSSMANGKSRTSTPSPSDNGSKPQSVTPWTTESLKNVQSLSSNLSPVVSRLQYATTKIKSLAENVNNPQEALQKASTALNELTGYTHIEDVKKKVLQQAESFETCRAELRSSKAAYEDAVDVRSSTQREINELLQRKHTWTGEDVTRFTELYRLEHLHSQQEVTAKENYRQCEKHMDRQYLELTRAIMERYHEEQLWSDKIRSVSTYGTWALMVVNLILFVAVQTVFEPYKRKRLTDRFEDLLVQKMADEEVKLQSALDHMEIRNSSILEKQDILLKTLTSSSSTSEIPNVIPVMKDNENDIPLLSNELAMNEMRSHPSDILNASYNDTLSITKKDLIIYTIEGALVGSAITALLRLYF